MIFNVRELEVSLTAEQIRQLPSSPITLVPACDDYEITLVETDKGIAIKYDQSN